MRTMTGRRLAVAATASALVAVLAACGASGDRASSADGPATDSGQKVANGAGSGPNAAQPPADAGAAGASAGEPGTGTDTRVTQRAIIYTGSMSVRVDDVSAAASRATAVVTGVGGFVGADKRTSDDSSSQATLELRVPAAKFQRVVDDLAGLGRAQRRDLNTQDVTEETVDLDARITTQRARVASGRHLLAQAKTLSDLVMLEGELAKREADLASLEAKQRRLADLTALSTITVELLGPNAQPAAPQRTETGFLAGLKGGWTALVALIRVLLTVIGAVLPFAVALGLPLLALLWLVRRFRPNRRPGPAPAAVVPTIAGLAAVGPTAGSMPVGPTAGPPAAAPAATPGQRGPQRTD